MRRRRKRPTHTTATATTHQIIDEVMENISLRTVRTEPQKETMVRIPDLLLRTVATRRTPSVDGRHSTVLYGKLLSTTLSSVKELLRRRTKKNTASAGVYAFRLEMKQALISERWVIRIA